jgi:hypothetical protein
LNTFVESFKRILKIALKGLQRNSFQFGCHIFLHIFCIVEPIFPLRIVSPYGRVKRNKEDWHCLDEPRWTLSMMWVPTASAHQWVFLEAWRIGESSPSWWKPSSGMLHCMALVRTDVSKEHISLSSGWKEMAS